MDDRRVRGRESRVIGEDDGRFEPLNAARDGGCDGCLQAVSCSEGKTTDAAA